MAFLSLPFFRQIAYEGFLRTHQGLAVLLLYAIWRHLPSDSLLPRICLYVSFGTATPTLLLRVGLTSYRNGAFTSRGHPRAYLYYEDGGEGGDGGKDGGTEGDGAKGNGSEKDEKVVTIRAVLTRPMKLDAGRYVNLWMPTVGLFSWAQTYPFMVTSWSCGKQNTLDFYVKAHHGLSATLFHHAQSAAKGSAAKGLVSWQALMVLASP